MNAFLWNQYALTWSAFGSVQIRQTLFLEGAIVNNNSFFNKFTFNISKRLVELKHETVASIAWDCCAIPFDHPQEDNEIKMHYSYGHNDIVKILVDLSETLINFQNP